MWFARRQPPPGSGLQQCSACRADCVVPVSWEEAGNQHWQIVLRCPECETYREVVVGNDVAKRYEADLSRGMEEIAAALARSDRARMERDVHALIVALERDLIDAADFEVRA